MKHAAVFTMLLTFLVLTGVPACSEKEDLTHKAAQEAVERIRTPIDKAKAAKDLQEAQSEEMEQTEEAAEEQ